MPSNLLSCPHCSEPLRIRDRRLIGKTIHCPECNRSLQIVADGPDKMALRPQGAPRKKTSLSSVQREQHQAEFEPIEKSEPPPKRVANWLQNPLVIAWMFAACAILLLIGSVIVRQVHRDTEKGSAVAADGPPANVINPKSQLPGEVEPGKKNEDAPKVDEVPASPQAAASVPNKNQEPDEPPVVAPRPVPAPQAPVAIDPPPLPLEQPVVAVKPPPSRPRGPVEVAAALALPIVDFEQTTPASVRELLQQIEELAGVPIRYDAAELQTTSIDLDERVSLQLHATTIQKVLDALLSQVGLAYQVEDGTIMLRPESAVTRDDTSPGPNPPQ